VGLPGRKTDISDCAWLARLGECELLKAVRPAGPVRHLCDLPIETLLIRAPWPRAQHGSPLTCNGVQRAGPPLCRKRSIARLVGCAK
jgi:hypothetical protein